MVELRDERDVDLEDDVPPPPMIPWTPPKKLRAPIRLISFLPRSRSKIVFALVMGCYSIAAGGFMSTSTWVAQVPDPPRTFYLRGDAGDIFSLLVLAPLIETLMLVGAFELVRRLHAPNWAQVITSALFISGLHVRPWWPHAFIVLPSFLIQCGSYLYWRRASWKQAYWVVVCIHAINNVLPALSYVGRYIRSD